MKELISILADSEEECSIMGAYRNDTADSLCPPRVRAMLASRACKSSVVIGDPLGRNEMQKVFFCSFYCVLGCIFILWMHVHQLCHRYISF